MLNPEINDKLSAVRLITGIESFLNFMVERHKVYIKKEIESSPPPWTTDPILREYKFTNVFRELDKGTIYCRENILPIGSPFMRFISIIMYRLFNRVSTWQEIEDLVTTDVNYTCEGLLEEIHSRLLKYRDKGNSVFTSAHMVNYGGKKYKEAGLHTKLDRAMHLWRELVFETGMDLFKKVLASDPVEQNRLLGTLPFFGPFLAYEVWCDMTYTPSVDVSRVLPLMNSSDTMINHTCNDFVNIGDGCRQGIEFVIGKSLSNRDSVILIEMLVMHQDEIFSDFDLKVPWEEGSLNLRSFEHSFCEYSKYYKLSNNLKGRFRMRYDYTPYTKTN